MVRLAGVSRAFPEAGRSRPVLTGLDLEVRRGERVGLLGPSGSGKSTLLNLVSGIELPDEGRIEVAGVPLHRLGERERTLFRRDRIGFVFQFFNLIPTLTVEENLLLPLELKGQGGAGARRAALDLLGRVGLADRAGTWPDRLSGGEQQRVALARALVHRPDLILADEPTGNLDRETGERVLDLLESLLAETGATLVTASHADAVAARMNRVLHLRDGRLRESPRDPS